MRGRAGAKGPNCAPGRWTGRAAAFGHTLAQAALASGERQRAWACGPLWPGAQHPASCGGPGAGARFAGRVGSSKCAPVLRHVRTFKRLCGDLGDILAKVLLVVKAAWFLALSQA